MKQLAFSLTAVLGVAIATPANAALFSWNVEYSGFWEEGAVNGSFVADQADAADGIVSIDEMTSWFWSWSGNEDVAAFDISSQDALAGTQFDPSFYVDGTENQPFAGLDQGSFFGGEAGEQLIDFEFLIVQGVDPFPSGNSGSGPVTEGALPGTVAVSDPEKVPEPATLLGLLALAAFGYQRTKPETAGRSSDQSGN